MFLIRNIKKILVYTNLLCMAVNASAQSMSVHFGSSIYICDDNTISGVGYNYFYQLGDGTKISRLIPVKAKGIQNAESLDDYKSMVLLSDGTVWQWNRFSVPDGEYGLEKFNIDSCIAIESGFDFNCFIRSDGSLWVLGDTKTYLADSVKKINIPKLKKVSAEEMNIIALCNNGSLWICSFASLYYNQMIFNQLTAYSNSIDICATSCISFIVKSDSTLWALLCHSDGTYEERDMNVPSVKKLFGSGQIVYAIQSDGTVWKLGNDALIIDRLDFIEVIKTNLPKNITEIATSGAFLDSESALYKLDNGDVLRYGYNFAGELGNLTKYPIDPPELWPHPCIAVDCDTITQHPDSIVLDTFAYVGEPVLLKASKSESDLYWWYNYNGRIPKTFGQEATVIVPNFDSTQVQAVLMDTYGCLRNERFVLRKICNNSNYTNPEIALDTIVYNTTNINLKAPKGTDYLWSPSDHLTFTTYQTTTANVTYSITYEVSYIDIYGCPAKERFIIKRQCDSTTIYNPSLLLDTVLIPNSECVLTAPKRTLLYLWEPDTLLSCSSCQKPTATVVNSIEYKVTATDSYGCDTKGRFVLHIRNCDTIELVKNKVKLDTLIHYPSLISLNASKGNSYVWEPSVCNNCQNPEVLVNKTATYNVEILDEWLCPFYEQFNITLDKYNITIPNVFTPNGDGKNDYFEIIGITPNSILEVFNSKGVVVYQSNNYQGDWDGRDNTGKLLNEGTYWYILNIPYYGNYKGWVYLKK
jgi:gliding motility-associated-like protein